MNICHIFCYPGDGGAEKYALYLSDMAQKEGNKIYFLFGGDGPLVKKCNDLGYASLIIEMPSWHSKVTAQRFKEYFDKNNIQIVHTHFLREHFLAVKAKKLGANIKIVRTFHRVDEIPLRVRLFYRYYSKNTEIEIAVSEYLANLLKEKKIARNPQVIMNGVPNLNITKHENALGYLGRLDTDKGIYQLVQENKEYFRKSKLIIAGTGPDEAKLKSLIMKECLNVELLGFIVNLENFFEQIDTLIFPSLNESTLPLSILESYSAGIPVVAFDIPVYKGLKCDQRLFVPTGLYKELLKRAITVSQENAEYSILVKNFYLKHFTINEMWQKTKELYVGLLG